MQHTHNLSERFREEQSVTPLDVASGTGRAERGRRSSASLLVLLLTLVSMASSLSAQVRTVGVPVARVTQRVNNDDRALLQGQVPPPVMNAADAGRLSKSAQMNHLVMILRPTMEQNHALQTLLDQQLDKGSANYHHWLTPDQFGDQFGVADSDIAAVTSWLSQQGLNVEQVAKSKRMIQFGGTVAQVESAFRTEMHSFNVKGGTYISNNSDISVPTALQAVIAGVPTLNNFFKTSAFHDASTVAKSRISGSWATKSMDAGGSFVGKSYFLAHLVSPSFPNYTNGTTHYVGAADFATIYNTTPLITGGFDGTGVSIGVIGRTDIYLEDVQMYRRMFGLKVNDPQFVVVGEDPGISPGDDGESYLDVEVSGGAAPGATIKFITSRATLTTDGVDLSAMYAVQNNLTDIISESYGQCEANFSAVQESFYTSLWQQAAAQGQTVFVSSGDNGPAGCDDANSTFSSFGYAVSGLASTPYNVAVGGTIFSDTAANWGATTTAIPFSSALGYIPEKPWNEAKGSGATGAGGLWSGSGGISAYIPTPIWQHGFGVPTSDPAYPNGRPSTPSSPFVPGPHRYMPDVAMAAASGHDGTLYCAEGICQLTATGSLGNAGLVGGTSVAAPTMAGIQALVNDVNGGRQGNANYVYYSLADAQHTAGLDCGSTSTTLDSNCAFRDIITGNTLICGNSTCTTATKLGWTAAAGYDMATGLGSPNATQLANLWATVTFRSTTTTLGVTPTTGITHGQSVTVSGTVAPGSGSGTPTGDVSFLVGAAGGLGNPMDPNTGGFLNPVSMATLDGSGNYTLALTNLPAGNYNVVARYSGDATFASSSSLPVSVTITPENSTVSIEPNSFNGTACTETAQTTFTYGSYVWTDVVVAGISNQGTPTGTVSITDNGNPLFTSTLNANGLAHLLSGPIPTTSCVYAYTFQDTPTLTAGTHLLAASYSGDTSFNASTATPVTVTITPATILTASAVLTTASTNIASGDNVQLTLTLAGLPGADASTLSPTGTVTFTDTTTSAVLGTATLSPTATFGGRAILNTTLITTAGINAIQASYAGDSNYNGVSSGSVSVTVQAGTSSSVAVTSNTNPAVIGGRPTFTATMTPTTVTSGTANFFDGGVLLGSGTVGAAHTATFRPAATVNLPAGVHNITATYAGNATFNSSSSPVFAQTFTQATTTVTLTATKAGGSYAEAYTMSALLGTVVAATPVTGTIQFYDGANPLGAPQPLTTVSAALGGYGLIEAQMGTTLGVGTHTLTAQLTDPNYTAPVSNTQTVTVGSGTPSVTATGGTYTYDGNPHAGSGSATGAANETLTTTLTYTGTGATTYGPTATAPTNAGTYQVVSHTSGDANNSAADSSPASLTINKANSVVSATGGSFTYNGSAHAGSGTATGGAGESLSVTLSYTGTGATTYGPTATAPTGAGTYQVTASTTGDGNNNSGTSSAVALTINKATPTFSVTGGTFTYDGTAHAGSATATGGASESLSVTVSYSGTGATTYGPSATAPTSAGTYLVTASTTGDANNNSGSSSATALTINKANPTVTATGGTFSHDGNPHSGSGSATGGAGETLSVTLSYTGTGSTTYGPTATAPNAVGTYQVVAHTAGDANNNAGDSAAAALSITAVVGTPTVTATGGTFTYDGTPHAGSGSATGASSETLTYTLSYTGTGSTTYGPTATAPTNAGTYQVVAHTPGDANNSAGDSSPAALTINKANPTVTATGGTFTFSNSAHAGSGSATGGASESLSVTLSYAGTGSTSYGPSATAPTNAGTYQVTASTTGDSNNNAGSSSAAALTINKATATISVSGYCVTYDGTSHSATGSATGVSSETLTGLNIGATTHTATGSYMDSWTFTNANYSDASGSVNDGISDATITASTSLIAGASGTASVADAGTGAVYAWTITGGSITGGNGTRSINFTAGASGSVALGVTVTLTAGCSDNKTASVTITHFDVNGDDTVDPSDIFYLVNYLFTNGPAPAGTAGMVSGDANGDSVVDPADIFYLINYLFRSGPHPASVTPKVSTSSVGSGSRMSGSITLGNGFIRGDKYIVPVIVTAGPDSMIPEAMSLKVNVNSAVTPAGISIQRVGAIKDVKPSFEVSQQGTKNDLAYILSLDPQSGGFALGEQRSAVVAEISIDAPNAGALMVNLDSRLTMLSNHDGSLRATVANGGLQLGGTTINGDSRQKPVAASREAN